MDISFISTWWVFSDTRSDGGDTVWRRFSVAYGAVTVAGERAGQQVQVTVQLCSAGPCAAPAAACVGPSAGDTGVPDAGRLTNNTGQSAGSETILWYNEQFLHCVYGVVWKESAAVE